MMVVYTRHRGAQTDDKWCAEKSVVEVVGSMVCLWQMGLDGMLVANGAILVVELW